jgi:collagen type I alpha
MAEALHLAGLVGSTITGNNFATATVTNETQGVDTAFVAERTTGTTIWAANTAEPYEEGGGVNPLTYTITATDDATQVVTFQVTGTSGTQTIFAQVVAWGPDVILFEGFSNASLTTGLQGESGDPTFFYMDSKSLVDPSNPAFSGILSLLGGQSATLTDPAAGVAGFAGAVTAFNTACFARGTAIQTPSGQTAVEDLAEGDSVLTASGETLPIQWIGSSHIRCRRHANPARVAPVRIEKHAFGNGLPVQDLVLSPEHAVYHDGVMIPVHCLVNGATIRQLPVDFVSYYHVELPHHDVLLAEGLPAESYLDTGNRHAMTLPRAEPYAA